MTVTMEPIEQLRQKADFAPCLWWVQLDTNLGDHGAPDWENSGNFPEPLGDALAHAEMVRAHARDVWQVFDEAIVRLVIDQTGAPA